MANVAAAFPFVNVSVDTSALQPVAQRSPGVIAIVGVSAAGAAVTDAPTPVESAEDATRLFGADSVLSDSLRLALLQDPKPAKIYGVKVPSAGATDLGAGLDALKAADDVGFVALAGITDTTALLSLKQHAEQSSAAGNKRLAVAMADPARAKSADYADLAYRDLHPSSGSDLLSTTSRIVVVAARGAVADDGSAADTASAAMAAMAGYAPSTSIVLKRVRGFSVPTQSKFTSTEIKALSEYNIIPLIQPALLVGSSFVFGEGRCFTSDANLLYVDIVRTLDDIDFRLKAGLLRLVGDARVTRAGLTTVKSAIEGILGVQKRAAVIDDYGVSIPVLDILSLPEATRSTAENNLVVTARANRAVDVLVSVTYGPAVHTLRVTLQPKF